MAKAVQQKLTAEQRVTKALVWILRSPNFLSMYPTACIGETRVIHDEKAWPSPMKTGYTDGRNIRFWHEFVDNSSDETLRAAILHETGHILARHILNYQHLWHQNAQLANIAADHWVNNMLKAHNDTGIAIGADWFCDPKYADSSKWDVTKIFKDLQKNGKGQGKCNGNCQQGKGSGRPNGQCTCPQGFDEHGWEDGNSLSPEEQKQLAQDVDQAIRQGQRLAGQMNGNKDLAINELLKVRTDYKEAFREWMRTYTRGGDDLSWARVSRRAIANGELMPGSISEAMGELAICIDTSGSISQAELTVFLSNVALITQTIKPLKIRLIYWDTVCHGIETYEPHQYDTIAQSTKAKGGGGTQVECVPPYLEAQGIKPEVILVLSDGYLFSPPPDFPAPTLWAILPGNEGFTAPLPQKTIHLPDGWSED
jgi:predicted metal-dependent peptidase